MPYPDIDPIIFQIGPFALRWYALAYIAGLMLGWFYLRYLCKKYNLGISVDHIDDYLFWATLGVIVGGRLGYVLFYQFDYYVANPLTVLQVWKGGMSFHGGFMGVVIATIYFARKNGLSVLQLSDLVALAAPIGLFFGRIANFINGELIGRVADMPWGVIFPNGGELPRHPSQLYEAALEGLLLFVLLSSLFRLTEIRDYKGSLTGIFLIGYGVSRTFAEFFRQPDAHLGFLLGGMTMGQWLSVPMILAGLFFIIWSPYGRRAT